VFHRIDDYSRVRRFAFCGRFVSPHRASAVADCAPSESMATSPRFTAPAASANVAQRMIQP
jgi:hypothetical protein